MSVHRSGVPALSVETAQTVLPNFTLISYVKLASRNIENARIYEEE